MWGTVVQHMSLGRSRPKAGLAQCTVISRGGAGPIWCHPISWISQRKVAQQNESLTHGGQQEARCTLPWWHRHLPLVGISSRKEVTQVIKGANQGIEESKMPMVRIRWLADIVSPK
ncbi:hypothetical protein KP509_14G093300 [Ceratopteris richardii]|uniref:Uncharacterized protein n=1 Tax=Ceratopteris richardii TaxID=49495 RepID=A0A8T2TCH5_CERRI|nr:hypothetical protein KP509_14G093300 [Ceratopteris richardii]